MLEDIQSLSLLTLAEIIGPIVLAAALVYGIMQSRGRLAETDARQRRAAAYDDASSAEPQRREERRSRAPLFVAVFVVLIVAGALLVLPRYASTPGIGKTTEQQGTGSAATKMR